MTILASPYLPQGLSIEGQRKDQFTFQSAYPADQPEKKMENLKAAGQIGFAKADYKGLQVGPTEIKLNADKGVLAVDLPETRVNGGTMQFAGDINLTSEPKMLRLRKPEKIIKKVQVNDEMTHAFLEYVNPFFAGATRVTGIADFSCDELVIPIDQARKELIQMKANLSVRKLKLQPGGDLKKLMDAVGSSPSATLTLQPTDFTVKDEVLAYQDMQLDIGDNPLNFSGQIGLNRELNLNMALPWTYGGRTIKSGQETQDRIVLPVGGTIDKPEVDWSKLIQYHLNLDTILQNPALQKEIEKGLDKLFNK